MYLGQKYRHVKIMTRAIVRDVMSILIDATARFIAGQDVCVTSAK